MSYYDGTKLLSMNDINGKKPEVYLVSTNRTGGKTTYFGRYFVNRFLKYGEKFMLLYRYAYEINDVPEKFFKDIKGLFFPENEMTSTKICQGRFVELLIDEKPCGYAVPVSAAGQVKKYSHLFSDVERMLFDEFEAENNRYCTNEVDDVISVHTSVARGQGMQVRYVPLFMLGNATSLLNPYFVTLGISQRLNDDTHFLRGDGYLLEKDIIESARDAQRDSGFNRAFAGSKYVQHAAENVYLNDSFAFVDKPDGKGRYLATLKYRGVLYGIKEYAELGFVYCDDKPDKGFPTRIVVDTEDHEVNYIMLRRNDQLIKTLRFYFMKGLFRFKNLMCKDVILNALKF